MKQIIGGRGTGKSYNLIVAAKENNGIVVCSNPKAMESKAHAYGIVGVPFISYNEFFLAEYERRNAIYIDELDEFLKRYNADIVGYTITQDE